MMLPTSHRQVLEILLTRFAAQDILWTLTGSTSFALQGMPLTPNDIDVQTDRYGVYVIADLFEADIIRPPFLYTTSRARSYFWCWQSRVWSSKSWEICNTPTMVAGLMILLI
ncbi:MAG: hypothetical protein GY762_22160 [Proteobacteria bacterium]|nr:hypothetical protein [Pseudomonadota bacterium]